ncbi:protein kinase domain-containing protein [Nocardia sp. IBHARD005]|uniref:protein kinase domain-containing protein n=1 Tax=Nocardia sp. IBHARD005 TaxID=3457765 RepID=UPI004058F475
MALGDDRWVEVSKSAYPHEAAGLAMLRYVIPDAAPYRAWTNFEFMDNHGQWHEVDALVLGRRRLHLIEAKHFVGELRGTEMNWVRTTPGGKRRTQRSPLLLTRRKAQRLATRIGEEARKVAQEHGLDVGKVQRGLPYVQESVFLHGSPFEVDMPDLAKSSLFAPDGFEQEVGLPAISTRILEPPSDNQRVDEDLSVIIALALKNLGIARRTERDAGSWSITTGTPLASGDDWQEWAATHKGTGKGGRARVVSFRRGTPDQARAAAHRRMQREFALLSSLRHDAIVAPSDLVQDDDGNTVIVYPEMRGFEPLDLALATRELTADQQLDILTQIAEAVAYAHRNHVAHRGLGPSTVLIHIDELDRGELRVRVADWSWAGRVYGTDTRSTTSIGTPPEPGSAPADEVYQAPEDRWAPDANRLALDVFSLGALAYYLLSGGQAPARDRAELRERLRNEHGMDLAASGSEYIDGTLRALVLQATNPSVSKRMKTDSKSGLPRFDAKQFVAALADYRHTQLATFAAPEVDPLNPAPGALLCGRFDVVRVLGAGSTARGVLVTDREHDDRLRVLKVGLDAASTSRLHDEAQVLAELAKRTPPIPGVVELIEGPIELGIRTALVLSNCGEQTLADVVRYTPLGETQLRTWGRELLDVVVALDAVGITHRDLKPSNLGLAKPEGRTKAKVRLALFDFSLSRAPVEQTEAGTPPYRDPFLGTGTRTTYDSAAERYSAAVVLYEMATAGTPVYGDGLSNPEVLDDDVAVATEDFTSAGMSGARAEALATFFRKALARNVKQRFDTAAAMRDAWAAVFTAQPIEPELTVKKPAPAPVSVPKPSATYTSLSALAEMFAHAAATRPSAIRRQVVELILGSHAQSPDDPFVTYQALAARAGVTSARIAQVFGEFTTLWARNPQLEATVADLRGRLLRLLQTSGGASTPELLARELAGALHTDGVDDPQRTALGVLRLVLSSPPQPDGDVDTRPLAVHTVRRQGAGTVAMISTSSLMRRLPALLAARAEQLVADSQAQGSQLVPAEESEPELRAVAATLLDLAVDDMEIPAHTLLRIAAAASTEAALSSRDELHARSMPILEALRLLLRGLSSTDVFGRPELESRLKARFPALKSALPKRADLDELVQALVPEMQWNDTMNRYEFAREHAAASYVPTRVSRPAAATVRREHGTSDAEYLLTASRQEHTFRALGIPMGTSDAVAKALASAFGATHIDVTDLLLSTLRSKAAEVGIDWSMILAADAGAVADREGLKGFVAQAIPALIEAVDTAPGPVVLTDLSTLTAYGQLDILGRWTDLTTPPPHAIWVLIPQREEAGGRPGSKVDGRRLPINSPEQFVQIDDTEVTVLLTVAHRDDSTVKEPA